MAFGVIDRPDHPLPFFFSLQDFCSLVKRQDGYCVDFKERKRELKDKHLNPQCRTNLSVISYLVHVLHTQGGLLYAWQLFCMETLLII